MGCGTILDAPGGGGKRQSHPPGIIRRESLDLRVEARGREKLVMDVLPSDRVFYNK